MKKLKLSELNLSNTEVLTREQLKKILGGVSASGGSGDYCGISTSCSLYITQLGITVTGNCAWSMGIGGGDSQCYCLATYEGQNYRTDPNEYSVCWK